VMCSDPSIQRWSIHTFAVPPWGTFFGGILSVLAAGPGPFPAQNPRERPPTRRRPCWPVGRPDAIKEKLRFATRAPGPEQATPYGVDVKRMIEGWFYAPEIAIREDVTKAQPLAREIARSRLRRICVDAGRRPRLRSPPRHSVAQPWAQRGPFPSCPQNETLAQKIVVARF